MMMQDRTSLGLGLASIITAKNYLAQIWGSFVSVEDWAVIEFPMAYSRRQMEAMPIEHC